ncbi:MAG: Oxidoreductase FAD/NAD(P)-binding domain protein [Microgenomates group bacterium GW2011_GWC1_44_9]|nr:MAG: Oxidoreductase FAD/NAD(P)-binding domain protein [Microgenomates group bacterium GW2011_GWC1_44_9]
MFKWLDDFLNSITMYRLAVYGLLTILAYAVILAFWGALFFTGPQLILSSGVLYLTCVSSNYLLSRLFKAQTNVESSTITALILSLILSPFTKPSEIFFLVLAGVLAMGSKYLLASNGKHIFNPAAISLLILNLFGVGLSVWWVGSSIMLPVVSIVGLLIVRKLRRGHLFITFVVFAIIMILLTGINHGFAPKDLSVQLLTSWPVFYFGTIMLTEPMTTPPTKIPRLVYGAIVGLFFGASFRVGPIFSSPEFALVVGNLFSFLVGFKRRIVFTLESKVQLSPDTIEFVFIPNKEFSFLPGQYVEWTLQHKRPDSRGNRRYFTIASSPTEELVRICSKFSDKSSSFKKALKVLKVGDGIVGSQLDGEFVLPEDPDVKMVFIAGGVGITPFRSMIRSLLDTGQQRWMILFYVNKLEDDIVYKEVFDEGKAAGLKTVYTLTDIVKVSEKWRGKVGYIDENMIKEEVPDYEDRVYYLSGPNMMVDLYKKLLMDMGIKQSEIKTDYFPGY